MIKMGVTNGWKTPSYTSPESIAQLWEMVRYFLKVNMPYIMIVVAFFIAIGVVSIVTSIITKDDEEEPVDYM